MYPKSISPYAEYLIVKLDLFPWYGYRKLQNYSFVFQVYRNNDINGSTVVIEIVNDKALPAMNRNILMAKKFIYSGGNLRIHEFIEIIEEKTRLQTQYIAVLSNQITSRRNKYLVDRNVLLLVKNFNEETGQTLKNKYKATYAMEFEASIKYQEAEERCFQINNLIENCDKNNPDVLQFLKTELCVAEKVRNQLLDEFLEASKPEYFLDLVL